MSDLDFTADPATVLAAIHGEALVVAVVRDTGLTHARVARALFLLSQEKRVAVWTAGGHQYVRRVDGLEAA